jgi:hypothetical protein
MRSPMWKSTKRRALKEKLGALFKTYWFAIAANIFYLVTCTVLATIQLSGTPLLGTGLNDFSEYYYAAQVFVSNPVKIYDQTYLWNTYHAYPFRYFPTVLLVLFFPFTGLPLPVANVVFSILSFSVNLANVLLVQAIILKLMKDPSKKFLIQCIAGFIAAPFFVDCYFEGQISCILALMLLLSLYFYLSGREFLGSLCLGLSLFVKPVPFFQIFFILFAALAAKDVQLLVKRAFAIILPLIPDALFFLFTPGLLSGFINLNFVQFERTSASNSASFSNFLLSLLHLPSSYISMGCLGVMLVIGILVLWKLKSQESRIMFAFIYGMLAYYVTQIDIWANQFPFLYPFLILAATYISTQKGQKWFYSLCLGYALAGEALVVYFTNADAIIPIIPVIAGLLLALVIYITWAIYRADQLAMDNFDSWATMLPYNS